MGTEQAKEFGKEFLYRFRAPLDSFMDWRDQRVMDEIKFFGWHIDYWMEGGEFSFCNRTIVQIMINRFF